MALPCHSLDFLHGGFRLSQHAQGAHLIERIRFADLAHGEADMNKNPVPSLGQVILQQPQIYFTAHSTTSISARFGWSESTSTTCPGIAKHISHLTLFPPLGYSFLRASRLNENFNSLLHPQRTSAHRSQLQP